MVEGRRKKMSTSEVIYWTFRLESNFGECWPQVLLWVRGRNEFGSMALKLDIASRAWKLAAPESKKAAPRLTPAAFQSIGGHT